MSSAAPLELHRPDPTRGGFSAVELAIGIPMGVDDEIAARLHDAQRRAVRRDPLELLDESIARAMSDHTIVQFSGGVDSSLVLAAATRAARARDLPLPIPFTLRYGREESEESAFQEELVETLGLTDWIILDVDGEDDLLSPASRAHLLEHGMSTSARVASRDWYLSELPVRDGSVLMSGEGGDEVLGPAPFATLHGLRWAVAHRRQRRTALGALRRRTTARVRRFRSVPDSFYAPWLTETGRTLANRLMLDDRSHPVTMKQWMRRYRSKRNLVGGIDSVARQAGRFGFDYSAPLLDLEFMAGLTASIPEHDFVNRMLVIRKYFPGLLPASIANRTSKASFNASIFGPDTQQFARSWDGQGGVPLELVDPEILRSTWLDASDSRGGLMLQSAWLTSQGR